MKMISTKAILVVVLLISLLSAGLYYKKTLSIGRDAIFCTDYEFICCGEVVDSSGYKNNFGDSDVWTCPSTATKCEIDVDGQFMIGKTNCREVGSWIFKGYVCDDEQIKPAGHYEIEKGSKIYGRGLDVFSFSYKIYKERLVWCGDSACDAGKTGIPVSGADGCTFVLNDDLYDKNGKIVKEVKEGDIAYTIPVGTCYLAPKGRHVCGYKSETCQSDSDCRYGHTLEYNGYGAECHTGRLEWYGCRIYGHEPTKSDLAILPNENDKDFSYGTRCEVIGSKNVQCCPYTSDCGPNAVCDPETFTCKSTAECTYDWECHGGSQECARDKLELVKWVCENGKCVQKTIKKVDCCYDTDCPSGYYCDDDYKCKESAVHKTDCPFTCCVDEDEYFDRPCPEGLICCPDHTCKVSCEPESEIKCGLEGYKCGFGYPDCCEGLQCDKPHFWSLTGVCKKPSAIDKLSWKLMLIPILALLGFFGLYAIKRDLIFGIFGAILGLLVGIVIYVMTWWKWLLLTLGGWGLGMLTIILLAMFAPIVFILMMRRR